MWEYTATVERVVDGDTIDVRVDLGFNLSASLRFRLARVNAPEKRGKSKVAGIHSWRYVEDVCAKGDTIRILTMKSGKYNRWVAEVYYTSRSSSAEVNLSDDLLTKGLAVPYG